MSLILFLDESGDHSLAKVDAQYPMFVLCGCVFDEAEHDVRATDLMNGFKEQLFGRTDIILHTTDFCRNQKGFEQMQDHQFRKKFFAGLEDLVRQIEFKVVACALRKAEHAAKYDLAAIDPYLLSLTIVIERFIFECDRRGTDGILVVESRNSILDNALELAFLNLKIQGTYYVRGTRIKDRVKNLAFKGKQQNITGLQLADVLATPIGRHVLGKATYAEYSTGEDFFKVIETKFRRDATGNYVGPGLVVLPK